VGRLWFQTQRRGGGKNVGIWCSIPPQNLYRVKKRQKQEFNYSMHYSNETNKILSCKFGKMNYLPHHQDSLPLRKLLQSKKVLPESNFPRRKSCLQSLQNPKFRSSPFTAPAFVSILIKILQKKWFAPRQRSISIDITPVSRRRDHDHHGGEWTNKTKSPPPVCVRVGCQLDSDQATPGQNSENRELESTWIWATQTRKEGN